MHSSQTTVWPSPYLGIREDSVASATTRRQSAAPLTRWCRIPPRHEPVGQGPSFRLVSSVVAAAHLSAAGERGARSLDGTVDRVLRCVEHVGDVARGEVQDISEDQGGTLARW